MVRTISTHAFWDYSSYVVFYMSQSEMFTTIPDTRLTVRDHTPSRCTLR